MKPIDPADLPSRAELFRASMVALAVALVVTVVTVLPAEFAVDPTGLGRKLGLLHLGELKQVADRVHPAVDGESVFLEETHRFEIGAGRGVEVKAVQHADDQLMYAWSASGPLYYDLHAEPAGEPRDVFESYATGTVASDEGLHVAAFDGRHGWYWKNAGSEPVTVELRLTGTYVRVER